tara:strand:- start:1497 stop:2162 length:666 start_codon:yes stop_codon:yes gene_type:complete
MIKRKLIFTSILFTYFMLVISCNENPEEYAVIITEKGKIFLRFFPEIAPKHVESFKILAREGLYNGTSFHRVIKDFVIQGGDPNSKDGDSFNDGQGGRAGKYFGIGEKDIPDTWTIPAEFNDMKHKKGTLSMARAKENDSAGSQFFICLDRLPTLDGKYTIFGEVIDGMDIVEKIGDAYTPRKRNPYYSRPDGDNPRPNIFMDVEIGIAEELGLELSTVNK